MIHRVWLLLPILLVVLGMRPVVPAALPRPGPAALAVPLNLLPVYPAPRPASGGATLVLGAPVISPTAQVPLAGAGFTPGATYTLSDTGSLLLTGTVSVAGFLSATLTVPTDPGYHVLQAADGGGRSAIAAYTVAVGGAAGPLLAVAPPWVAPGGTILAAWAGFPPNQKASWRRDGLCPQGSCPVVPTGPGAGTFTTAVPTPPAAYVYTLALGETLPSVSVQVNAGLPAYGSGTRARAPSDAPAAWGAVGEGFLPGEPVEVRLNGALVGNTTAGPTGVAYATVGLHTVGDNTVEKLALTGATSDRVAYAAIYYVGTAPALPGQVQGRWENATGSTALVVADGLGYSPAPYSVLLDGRPILTGTTDGSTLAVYSYTVPLGADPGHNLTTQLETGSLATSRALILPCTAVFADVPGGDPFYPYVHWLACYGYINGYGCGGPGEPCNATNDPYYRPGATLTRGQLMKMIGNAARWPIATPPAPTFADVPATHPFFPFVETAVSHGVISGYQCGGDGEPCDGQNRPYFRPGSPITRGQLSKVITLARAYALGYPAHPTFADVPTTQPFYPYVEALARQGVISGYGCGGPGEPCDGENRPYFRPAATATRGQVAKFVTLAYGGP